MSSRDAYRELGFHSLETPPHAAATSINETERPIAPIARGYQTRLSGAAALSTERTRFRLVDHITGLLLILAIFLIGLFSGFFGRGGLEVLSAQADMSPIFATESSLTSEMLPSEANADIALFGSAHADQILAIEPLASGGAMVMTKSHLIDAESDSATRLIQYEVSEGGQAFSVARTLDGAGLDLVSLDDGVLVALTIHEGELIVSGRNQDGRRLWSHAFASSALGRQEISIAKHARGFNLLAPSDTTNRVRIASIGSDGAVAWEKTLDQATAVDRTFVTVGESGLTFAIIGTSAQADGPDSESVVILDEMGRLVNQSELNLMAGDRVSGLVAHRFGGAALLISGPDPRLEHIDASGDLIERIDLPYLQSGDFTHVLPLENGDLIIASAFDHLGPRVDALIEQRNMQGDLVAQRTISLPESATFDALTQVSKNEFFIGGSMRTDRYEPTNLFMRRIAFHQDLHPAMTLVDLSGMNGPAASGRTDLNGEAAWIEETPVIASLTVSTAPTPAPADLTARTSAEILADNELQAAALETVDTSVIAELDSIDPELTVAELPEARAPDELALDDSSPDLDAAATSRILEPQPMRQCRFTCLDPNSGTSFPMTGYVSPMSLLNPAEAQAVHARICSSAGLLPNQNTQASCGFN